MEVDPTFATYLFFIKLYPKSMLTFFPVRPSSLTLKDGASRGLHREKPTLACVLVVGRRYAAGTKLSVISDAQNTRRSLLTHTTGPMRVGWVSNYHCHLRVRRRERLCVTAPRSLASNSMLWPRRDVSLLFTALGSGPDMGTCPRSREILAKGTSGVHTLLQGVDCFKHASRVKRRPRLPGSPVS